MSAFFDPRAWRRRLVLGFAFVAAIGAIAVTPPERAPLVTPAFAQAAKAAADDAADAAPRANPAEPPAAGSAEAAPEPTPAEPSARPSTGRRHHGATVGVTVDKNRVHVLGIEGSQEYDSFAEFVHESPWLAALFFVAAFLVFLMPLLVIIVVVWYKMRKTRMLNETMLKLAEKGVVPPAEAMDAIGAVRPEAAMAAGETTSALYARAQGIHARSVWSDLRRGIILVAVGLAVQTCSMVEDGEANGVGLVLLFLGIGYIVLWYFEDRRHPAPARVDTSADRAP